MKKNYAFEMIKKMSNDPANKKIAADFAVAIPLLERVVSTGDNGECLTLAERMTLVRMVPCNLHEDGKIEGISSIDSSCGACEFCQKMQMAAENNPFIICKYCYDEKQEKYRKGMAQRHALNAAILSLVLFDISELATIPATDTVREDSSGDVVNVIHARNYIRFSYAHPYANVALWAKNVEVVTEAFDIEGKPQNMKFIQSSIMIGKKAKLSKYADNTFTVYLTEEEVLEAIRNGANPCNGRKCKECGMCCYKQGDDGWKKGTDIAELFRAPKSVVKELLMRRKFLPLR